MNVFFRCFHKSLTKNPALHKITIDLFETFVTSICEEKVLAKLQLFHAEQMSLYNFIILRKKRDSNTCVVQWNL